MLNHSQLHEERTGSEFCRELKVVCYEKGGGGWLRKWQLLLFSMALAFRGVFSDTSIENGKLTNEVGLVFKFCRRLFVDIFPFPPSTDKLFCYWRL